MDVECPRCLGAGSLWTPVEHMPKCSFCFGEKRVDVRRAVEWRLGIIDCSGFSRAFARQVVEARGTERKDDLNPYA